MSTTVPSFTDLQRKTLQQTFQRSRIRKRSIVYPERGVMQLRSGMLMFCDLEVTVGDIIERLEAIASRIVSGDFDVSRKPVPVPGKSLLDFMQYIDKRTGGRHSDPFLGFARFYDAANELRSVYDSLSEESTRHLDKLTPDMSMPAFLDQFGSPPLSLSDLTRPISRRRGAPINRERLEIAKTVGQLLVRSGIKLVKSRRGAFLRALDAVLDTANVERPDDLYPLVVRAIPCVEYAEWEVSDADSGSFLPEDYG